MTSDPATADWTERKSRRADQTRAKLLDCAARLFSERGYVGTSTRAVTNAAGVSVSAANYHFGSKRALLHAVCERQIGSLNAERMRALDEVEARAHPNAPSLEDVLRAFLTPAIVQAPDRQSQIGQVAARLYADPPEIVAELKRELFGPIADRMIGLLGRVLPGASALQLDLALQLTIGAMVHVVAGHLEVRPQPAERYPRDGHLVDALVAFCAAGIRSQDAVGRETVS